MLNLPSWVTSVDSALGLFPENGPNPVLRRNVMHRMWHCGILARVYLDGKVELVEGSTAEAYTPARALCIVWLKHKEDEE